MMTAVMGDQVGSTLKADVGKGQVEMNGEVNLQGDLTIGERFSVSHADGATSISGNLTVTAP